ncbi:MAG TPA: hypothetical protein PKY64_00800 [Anaerolineaceae bacterium]|nr:hypothetical protein [Anaerolineaceae bacterium]
MAENRYIPLQNLRIVDYEIDAPVEIEKGSLFSDTQTKSVFLLLKLKVLRGTPNDVASVTVNIQSFNSGETQRDSILPVEYTYHGLAPNGQTTFGDDKPIVLDPETKYVQVTIKKVVFSDLEIWNSSGNLIHLPEQVSLEETLTAPQKVQLKRDLADWTQDQKERVIYFPRQDQDYWQCCCGRPNPNESTNCHRCKVSKNLVFQTIDLAKIEANLQEKLKRNQEIEERQARKKKKFLTFGLIGISLAIFIFIFIRVLLPFVRYNYAINLIDNKKYDQAMVIFESLDGYKQSNDMILEAEYQKANNLLENQQFSEAKEIFRSLGDYKSSSELILEADYLDATRLFSEANYTDAISLFSIIPDYKDAGDMIKESKYLLASDFVSNREYEQAILLFSTIPDYKDAEDMIKETKYLLASEFTANEEYEEAISVLSTITNFRDSGTLINSAKFKMAEAFFNSEEYSQAMKIFLEIPDYPGVETFLSDYYQLGKQYLTDKNYDDAILVFSDLEDYSDSQDLVKEANYQKGINLLETAKYSEAVNVFKNIGNYKDSAAYLKDAQYELGLVHISNASYSQAATIFASLGDFKDSKALLAAAKIDRTDPNEIINMVRQTITSKNTRSLATFIPDSGIRYANYFEGGMNVSKDVFLEELNERLLGSPSCLGITQDSGSLMLWYSNWKKSWIMTETCYADCKPLTPPWFSSFAAFYFRLENGKYQLKAMILKDPTNYYYSIGWLTSPPLMSCVDYPTCKGAPDTRLSVGMQAYVCLTSYTSQRVRWSPGRNTETMTSLARYTVVEIIDGPVCMGDNWTWWKVQIPGGRVGWMTEGGDEVDDYYLCPVR